MGKLKPIGSEKLSGMEKINRMIEIARYKENIPTPINEDKSLEYSIRLSDGNKYQIAKEKTGYVIVKNLTESNEVEYLEPLKNRKFYSSYSQAFKRLNLIAKELNTLTESTKNISLFTEGEKESEEKVYLKLPETMEMGEQTTPAPAPMPAPAPAPAPTQDASMVPSEEPTDTSMLTPEEMPSEEPIDSDEKGDDEEVVTMKTLQKLTGKLGQKIREFKSSEENVMSSKDIKYIINSVLSALDLSSLDDEDKEQIMSKFEGGESEDNMDTEEMSSEETPSEETPSEEPIAPPAPQGEMAEDFDEFENDELPSKFRRKRHFHKNIDGLEKHHSDKIGEFFEGVFNESKIDKVIGKYFILSESEQKQIEKNKKTISKIKKLSENITQEVISRKFFEKNPSSELIGKTNKKNLVFKLNEEQIRITPNGKTI
jgi:hypothetical protein